MSIRFPRRVLARILLVGIGLLVLGNAVIALSVPVARAAVDAERPEPIEGVDHLRVVDDKVWRGEAPSAVGYESLAAAGVTTIVDLRAERDIEPPLERLAELGLTRVHLPIRDGQTPTREQVLAFQQAVAESDGLVYVHCGAGVGRAGSISGALLVLTGEETPLHAVARNIAIGPPSIEQLWYVGNLTSTLEQPPAVVSAISRVFDAPRRIWSRVR